MDHDAQIIDVAVAVGKNVLVHAIGSPARVVAVGVGAGVAAVCAGLGYGIYRGAAALLQLVKNEN